MRWWLFVLCGCGRLAFEPTSGPDGGPDGAMAWPPGAARSTLTVAGTTEPLLDITLPVFLDASRADLAVLGTGESLRFYADSREVLAHELEAGTPLVAWVRLPRVDGPTTITMAYGDPDAPAAAVSAWSDAHLMVHHMAALSDSATDHDAVSIGASDAPGRVGRALDFVEVERDYLRIPDATTLEPTTRVTMSAWFFMRSMPQVYSAVMSRAQGTTVNDELYLGVTSGMLVGSIDVSGGNGAATAAVGGTVSPGAWHHLAVSWDGTTLRGYIDATLVDTQSASGTITHSPNPILIGANRNNVDLMDNPLLADVDFVEGLIDEVRLERVDRSDAWLAYQLAAMTDSVITYGPIER